MPLRPRASTFLWRFWRLSVVTLVSLLIGASVWSYTAAPPIPPGSTVVTFTFSDSTQDHTRIEALFGKYGMRATLQVISGRIGQSGYLSQEELHRLADVGHEVGGHTLHHVNLSNLTPEEARKEICDDRAALMSMGFPVTSFTYPFSGNLLTRQLLIECNYNSARTTGGIKNPYSCATCPPAETLPPADPFHIRAVGIKAFWTLADLQSLVLQTEQAGGGWMVLSLHDICTEGDTCSDIGISEALLDEFLAWLAPRSAQGTRVLTTHEVIGGAVKPPVWSDGGTPDAGTPSRPIPLPNPSLETDSDGNNEPDCWKRQNLGTTVGGWLRTTEAHSDTWAQRPRISEYTSGDRRLVVRQDPGTCAPAATPGRSYRVSAWYKTDAPAAFVASYRTSAGTWVTWTTGPFLPTSPVNYVRGEWVTPPLPPEATHLSVGLALRGVGRLFMDDFTLEELP